MTNAKVALIGFEEQSDAVVAKTTALLRDRAEYSADSIREYATVREAAKSVVVRKENALSAESALIVLSSSVLANEQQAANKLAKIGARVIVTAEPFDAERSDDDQRKWIAGHPYPEKEADMDDLLDDLFGDDEEEPVSETPVFDAAAQTSPESQPIPVSEPQQTVAPEEPPQSVPISNDPFGLPAFGQEEVPEPTPPVADSQRQPAREQTPAYTEPAPSRRSDVQWEEEDLESALRDDSDRAANPFDAVVNPTQRQPEPQTPEPGYRHEEQAPSKQAWNLQQEIEEDTPEPAPQEGNPSPIIQPPAYGRPSYIAPSPENRPNTFESTTDPSLYRTRKTSRDLVLSGGRRAQSASFIRLFTGSNGGAGKTTVSYQCANIHASMLRGAKSERKVWLLESDYENPKLGQRIEGATSRNLGIFMETLTKIAENQGAMADHSAIQQMKQEALDNSAVELPHSHVRVLAAPYDTTARSTVNVTTAINSAVQMIIERGDYVYIDAPTLTSIDDRLNAALAKKSGAVIIVGNTGDNTADVIRAFHALTKSGGRVDDGHAAGGIGVDERRVHIFLNKVTDETFNHAVQEIAAGTGHAVQFSMDLVPEWLDSWAGRHKEKANAGIWRHLVNTLSNFLLRLDPSDEAVQQVMAQREAAARQQGSKRKGFLGRFFRLR